MSSTDDDTTTAADALVDFMANLKPEDFNPKSVNGAAVDVEGFCYVNYRIEQYAQDVIDWSTQYGSDYSISYTASNITGRPSKFPEYGDFPETYAMRTYGDWWDREPSGVKDFQVQNFPKIPAHNFIVIDFEDYVIPEEVVVFETFNPGAIVRIWAYTVVKTWICLWEALDLTKRPPNRARRFSPPLKNIRFPTNTIRLEFNHSQIKYIVELDAVLLRGRKVNVGYLQQLIDSYERQKQKSSLVCKLQSWKFRPNIQEDYEKRLENFFRHDLKKFISLQNTLPAELMSTDSSEYPKPTYKTGLIDMPFEIVLKILEYLDLKSLFRVGQVSRFLYDVSTHATLYSEINLKPYWYLASNDLLCTLAKRATVLKKLDLSWCGLFNEISPTEFKKFIHQRGDNITHLRLNSSKFLNLSCIETMGIVCDNLRELSLRNCSTDYPILNFSCLGNLKNLERLDLYQTVVEHHLLLVMLENNRKLKHLNLAFSSVLVRMDEVMRQIGTFNQQLISLDIWKSHFLTAAGLLSLSNCHDLEEVDFGWCLREISIGESLRILLTNCPKLRKLFLTTARSITDRDVEYIASLCSNLEQLDLTGVIGISKERYYELLAKCKKLQLLDLSFCDNIDEHEISLWARVFKVNIICSHVPLVLIP